mgnify:CR=1 FL=1|jgi:BolA protein
MTDSTLARARIEKINAAIELALSPEFIDVSDESHLHAGHEGARSGRGHFHVTVVAAKFSDQSLVKRHRLIYNALGTLMESDIHALGIDAFAPDEPRA